MKISFTRSKSEPEKAIIPALIYFNDYGYGGFCLGWWDWSINLSFKKK